MSLMDQETAWEATDYPSAPEVARDAEVARLEAELSQARRQIAELQHLLKYRAAGTIQPLAPAGASEPALNMTEEAPAPLPAPAVPIKQPVFVKQRIPIHGRRAALSAAGLGLAVVVVLAALLGNSLGRRLPAAPSAKGRAAAQANAPLLHVADGPVIAPVESAPNPATVATTQDSAGVTPTDTAKSESVKKSADTPPAKPHRHHKRHKAAPAKPKDETPPADVPDMQPPDTEPGVDL